MAKSPNPAKSLATRCTWYALAFIMLLGAATGWPQRPAAAKSHASAALPTPARSVDDVSTSAGATPKPAEYLVGEGDVLNVSVWREPEISQTVSVRPDGKISLPLMGEATVTGLSPRQIQELVTDRLKSVLNNPQVTISVTEVRSKMVYITGSVGRPGEYSAVAPMTVLQLIARAGGLTEFANRKNIYVLRAGAKGRVHFNYKEVVKGRSLEQNVLLQPGDTVVVP